VWAAAGAPPREACSIRQYDDGVDERALGAD
jgi:hypothetical protein